ncbi:MAG: plasmid mobilization relaxosome protein MobC, partial [Thermomicrobiales bacterium]
MSRKTPKTTVIAVRVSIEQREAIEKAAVTAGASLSGFVAATMAEAMSRKKAAPVPSAIPHTPLPRTQAAGISISDPSALAELKRIGININQLAHATNAGYPPNVASMLDNLKGLLALLSELDTFKRHIEHLTTPAIARPKADEPLTPLDPPPRAPPVAPSLPAAPPQRRTLPRGLASAIAEAAAARPA